MASRAGVPHTAPNGVMVHGAFPPFPPNQKKKNSSSGLSLEGHSEYYFLLLK